MKTKQLQRQRVLFVEALGKTNVFSRSMNLPLMGPIYLATILKERGHDVQVINEHMLGRKLALNDLDADILCLTGLSSTIPRAYELAMMFKAKHPDRKVIMGGIHVTFMNQEALRFADQIIVGEGEKVIVDVIEGKIKDKIVRTSLLEKLDEVPIPDFSLLANNKKLLSTPVITSRGCPFGCTFCSVTKMFGRGYRTLSTDRVVQTLEAHDPKKVFFYDDNFTANKTRTYELLRKMKQQGLDFKWSSQVRTDVTNDPKLVAKMADQGCDQVYVGFESVNPETLKHLNKAQNVDNIKNSIKIFHDHGIDIHGMFMFGSDKDDKSVFSYTSDFCHDFNIDTVQYMVLTPLVGTEVFADLESSKRLLHRMWQYYDGMHAVFEPKLMTPFELQQGMIDSFRDFYSCTKALTDAVNIVFETGSNAMRSLFSDVSNYVPGHPLLKLAGKGILNRWCSQNSDYMKYLYNSNK
jgi:anaerobic magnesium-protoporphyrin IX monomethyl ester cyclase